LQVLLVVLFFETIQKPLRIACKPFANKKVKFVAKRFQVHAAEVETSCIVGLIVI